jgi:hypothetical protein
MISVHLLSQAILEAKITVSFNKQMFNWVEAENKLLTKELLIQKNPENYQADIVAFVPDHLEFGCGEGIDIFQVTVFPFQSFVAVRNP